VPATKQTYQPFKFKYINDNCILRDGNLFKRLIGRFKICWEDDVLENTKSMNVRNWK